MSVAAVRTAAAGAGTAARRLLNDRDKNGLDPHMRRRRMVPIDRRALHVADFLLDDPVIVLDHPDITGFVLVDDKLVDLSHPGTDLHHIFGVDDA